MRGVLIVSVLLALLSGFVYAEEGMESNSTQVRYRWIDESGGTAALYDLMRKVDEDITILCPQRFEKLMLNINNLLKGYEYTKDPVLASKLETLGNNLEYAYNKIKQSGCFEPERFLGENFLPAKKGEIQGESPLLKRLYRLLELYMDFKKEGGWEPIVVEDVLYLKVGREYDAVPRIKRRLAQEGFYRGEDFQSRLYTEELAAAVKEFQRRHGLKPDGIIGPMTLSQMNVPVEEKIAKILLNIERARWFLKNEDFFVFVDIPGFFLEVYKDGEPIFRSDVIVGRKSRPTPQMRNVISYAVLNPYWRAPKTIIKEDILPHLKAKEFEKIRAERIVASLDPYGKELVNFEDVDWSYFSWADVPFYFLQLPGPQNFLGFIKFMFPNRFDVYLHDTNARELFKYSYRALSSGCVRVKKPIELYHVLLNRGQESGVTYRDIFDQFWDDKTKKVRFRPNIPVYLLYLTTFMDEEGRAYFYPDIYGIDANMSRTLPLKVNELYGKMYLSHRRG